VKALWLRRGRRFGKGMKVPKKQEKARKDIEMKEMHL